MIMLMQIWLRTEQSLRVVGGGTVPPGSGWRDVQLVSADRRGGGTSVQAVGGGTSVPGVILVKGRVLEFCDTLTHTQHIQTDN
jgi:hypothetical protein